MAIPAHVYHAGVLPGLQRVLGSLWDVAGLVQTAQHASVAEWLIFVLQYLVAQLLFKFPTDLLFLSQTIFQIFFKSQTT